MARNVELKAKVESLDAVRSAVSQMAVTRTCRVEQEDTFFRLPEGRLKLRVHGDGSAELIYYERPDEPGAKLSSYERAACADAPAMQRLLERALGRRGVVRKHREVFIVDDTRIHLDSCLCRFAREGARARSRRSMSSRQALVLGLLLAAAMLMVRYAAAHHSLGTFDTDEQIRLEGEVVAFEWTNPHTWTWLDVTNSDGSVTRWGLEGMSPGFLGRRGWTRRTLQPGDRVEILVAPLKSGEPGGTFLRVTLPDGTEKLMFGGR